MDHKKNQDWAVEIWGEIAKRYKDTPWVGGYDLLNEPVHGDRKSSQRNSEENER